MPNGAVAYAKEEYRNWEPGKIKTFLHWFSARKTDNHRAGTRPSDPLRVKNREFPIGDEVVTLTPGGHTLVPHGTGTIGTVTSTKLILGNAVPLPSNGPTCNTTSVERQQTERVSDTVPVFVAAPATHVMMDNLRQGSKDD